MTTKHSLSFTEDQWVQIYRAVCDKADFLDLPQEAIDAGLELPKSFDPEGAPWQLREIAKSIYTHFNPEKKDDKSQSTPRTK